MSRFRQLFLIVSLAVAAGAGGGPGRADLATADTPAMAVAGPAAVPTPTVDSEGVEDPFPIVRLRVTEDRLAEALKHLDPGTVVRMPRSEFEGRVRKTGLAAARSRTVPRLVEAKYSASFSGDDLAGDVEWDVLNPRSGPAFLPLNPLRVAVLSPTWADGREAVVGAFGPKFPAGPGVWVPGSGKHVLRGKWSATGSTVGGERQFELRLPSCPISALDLNLPADHVPVATSADVFVTGPFPAGSDGKLQTWRFRFGDRSRVEFSVRKSGNSSGMEALLASLFARYELAPGQVSCAFEYDLRPARGTVGEWAFRLPQGLQVTDAIVNNRAGWRIDPASHELRVALKQPGSGGKLLITAMSPLPGFGKTSPLPVVRPVGAVIGEERLEVRIHPDLQIERWEASDYRLTNSEFTPDRFHVLTAAGSLLSPGTVEPFRRPPAVCVAPREAELTTNEGLEWRVEAGRALLTARMEVRARRGPVFQLRLQTPSGYSLNSVTSTPEGLVAYTGPSASGPGVVLEFSRPVLTGQSVELQLVFRGPVLATGVPARLPFPRVTPVDAAERNGWVSLSPGPTWTATAQLSPGAEESSDPDYLDLPPPPDAVATYTFRGREPEGELVLSPVKPAFTATATTDLSFDAGRLTATTDLAVKVSSGSLARVIVFEPGPTNRQRAWKVAGGSTSIAAVHPIFLGRLANELPLLGRPWGGLAPVVATRASDAQEPGTYWVIRFTRPVESQAVLETTARVSRVMSLDEARRLADQWASGRRELLTVRGATRQTAQINRPPVLGGPSTPQASAQEPPAWVYAGLYHVTVCSDGQNGVVFGGSVTTPGDPVLPLRLPPGAEVQAACIGKHWFDPGRCAPTRDDEGTLLRLPLPAESGPIRFEVRYLLPPGERGAFERISSPAPVLPGVDPETVQRLWLFHREVLPAWPFGAQRSAATLPAFLGQAVVANGREPTVSAHTGDTVTVIRTKVADAIGLGLAAVVAATGWLGYWRVSRWVGLALLVVLVGGGVVLLVAPPGLVRVAAPVLVVGLAAFAGIVVSRGKAGTGAFSPVTPRPLPAPSKVQIAVAVGAICAIPLTAALAQPAAQDVVFLLPGGTNPATPEMVVAPRALLNKLDTEAQQPEPETVMTAAAYEGHVEDGAARFTARLVVHSFTDTETPLALPLADVRLERASIDGKPASPVATRPDLYTVAITGRGKHEIELRFIVPINATGPEREVRFAVPEVPGSRLTLTAPTAARQLQAVGRFGHQSIRNEAGLVRLEADLGGARVASVRWRQAGGGATALSVREGCMWDLSESGAGLTACYRVRVESGAASGFRFDVPAELETVRVAVRPLDAATGQAGLRDWSVGPQKGGFRQLRIDLLGPVDGRFLVVLECVPRGAPTRQPVLRFPRPVGMDRQGSVYGLRANGVAVERVGRTGVIDFTADTLSREFGSVLDRQTTPASSVQAFSPRPGEAGELRPSLRPDPSPGTATQDVKWRVAANRGDGEGTVKWSASDPVTLLEFALPGGRVIEVRGPDVAEWGQADGRVQVWLRKPAKAGAVEWIGTATPLPPGKSPSPLVVDPPIPQLVNMRTLSQTLRLRPADGWAVRVDRDRGWKPATAEDGREWAFQSQGSPPPVRFHLFPPQGGSVSGFGTVEMAATAVSYRCAVEVHVPPGRPNHLVLRADHLPSGSTAALEVPPGTTAHDRLNTADSREWNLDAPPSSSGVFRAVVVVRFSPGGLVRLPTVWCGRGGLVPSATGIIRTIGVIGDSKGARLEGATRLSPASWEALQARWPGEIDRLRRTNGVIWAVAKGPTALITTPQSTPAPVPSTMASPAPSAGTPPAPPSVQGELPPLLHALEWCAGVLALAVLFVAFPRTTWPEQIGLVGALFGFAVAGGVAVGVVALGLARTYWLMEWINQRRLRAVGAT